MDQYSNLVDRSLEILIKINADVQVKSLPAESRFGLFGAPTISTSFLRPLVYLLLSKHWKISTLVLFWPIFNLPIRGKISRISLQIRDPRWSGMTWKYHWILLQKSRDKTHAFRNAFVLTFKKSTMFFSHTNGDASNSVSQKHSIRLAPRTGNLAYHKR